MISAQAGAASYESGDPSRFPQSSVLPGGGSPSAPHASVAGPNPTGAHETPAHVADLWAQCRETLRAAVSDALWLGYFRHLHAVSIDSDVAVLAAPNNLIRDRIQRRYMPMLQAALQQLPVRPQQCRIETAPEPDDATGTAATSDTATHDADLDRDPPDAFDAMHAVRTPAPSAPRHDAAPWHPAAGAAVASPTSRSTAANAPAQPTTTQPGPPQLGGQPFGLGAAQRPAAGAFITNAQYTFENFVTAGSNRFAQAAALAVAETPGAAYNPLFIYGGTGLGKTHLLQAIVNYLAAISPDHRVRYASTETFLNEFVEAIQTNTQPEFKRRYRELDLLLLDDIQIMEGKEGLQEELFHTFNSLHVAGRQIVISSDRSPRHIATLSDRLRSRFEWGLIADIQPPDIETRMAILRKKSEGAHVPDEVLGYIARLVTNNIRELEGALVRVSAYASLDRAPVTLEVAQHILSDIAEPQEKIITTDSILHATAEMFGYDIAELTSHRRQQGLVKARQISMYVMRELTDLSYPAIASVFGGRDHTTVMHAVKRVNSLLPTERKVYDQVAQLMARVRAA